MTAIQCVWTGEVFRPLNARQVRDAAAQHGQGEIVALDVVKGRSKTSHDHFFAVITEAHRSLPDGLAERFPTPDSLRHYALCQSGHCDVKHYACASNAEAIRWLPRIQALSPAGSQVAVVGGHVVIREPHSQSMKAMGGKVFQESKSDVLEVIATLLETTSEVLARAA